MKLQVLSPLESKCQSDIVSRGMVKCKPLGGHSSDWTALEHGRKGIHDMIYISLISDFSSACSPSPGVTISEKKTGN